MKMPRRLRLILVAVIVTALLAVALWPAARLVDTATVDVGLVRQTIEAEGRTRLKDRYEITAPLAATARRLELEPGDFLIHGHLGDALQAQPETSAQAAGHYRQAARMVQDYVDINPDDARALAAWGWYLANLGEPARARALVERSEARAGGEGSVALINAQTLSRVGSTQEVLARVAQARQAGISDAMITANAFLQHVPGIGPSTDPPAR